jgi:CheY-like chemotaxis protein
MRTAILKCSHEPGMNSVEKAMFSDPSVRPTTVLLVDDHVVVRKGLRDLLEEQPGIEVVGEAGDGQEAVELACALLPDVILMDINMPHVNGIIATRRIKGALPAVQIIGLSMHDDAALANLMRAAGAAVYLRKDAACDELIRAIIQLAADRSSRAQHSLPVLQLWNDYWQTTLRFEHQLVRLIGEWLGECASFERWAIRNGSLVAVLTRFAEDNQRMAMHWMTTAMRLYLPSLLFATASVVPAASEHVLERYGKGDWERKTA